MRRNNFYLILLALCLALMIAAPSFAAEASTMPEDGQTLENIPEPDGSQTPDQEPEDSQPPEDATEPDGSQAPEEVPEPEDSQTPEDATESDDSQPPEDTTEPDDGQTPEEGPEPEDGQTPEDATEPDGSQTPEEEPEDGQTPEEAPEPDDGQSSEEQNPEDVSEDLESEGLEAVIIEVIVPSSGEVLINPYQINVDLGEYESDAQIIHSFQTLENRSQFPVSVTVRTTGTLPAGSEASFAAEPLSPDTRSKDIFLYVEFQNHSDQWTDDYAGASNQLVITEQGNTGEDVLVLDPFGKGYFQLFGEMAAAPASSWEETDTFGAVLSFTFSVISDVAEPPESTSADSVPELPEPPAEAVPSAEAADGAESGAAAQPVTGV